MTMKKILSVVYVSSILVCGIFLLGSSTGRTGRTLKTSTQGCSCHGSSSNANVSVVITGPEVMYAGETAQYTLTITRSTQTGAGLDIAVRQGALNPVSPNIHLSNGELTHNENIAMSNGTMSVQFNYTAPPAASIDTIWSTGNATNSNALTSGDEWNWSVSKRVVIVSPLKLNLTGIIEGFWNGSTMVSDTVKTFLHNSSSPYARVDSGKIMLNTSGTGLVNFPNAAGGSYYIDIEHRNALRTWSGMPQSFTPGVTTSYDFTPAASQAYGSNMIYSMGKYVFYSGDPNHDETIDLSDIVLIFNDATVFTTGYTDTDINGDDFIDLTDITITFNNASNFVSVISP